VRAPVKVHWIFRGETGTYAWCSIGATGPVSDDPAEVTCKSCRRALEREQKRRAGRPAPAEGE
jgi:hypothetical protein